MNRFNTCKVTHHHQIAHNRYLVNHVLQLGLCGVLAQGAHDGAQLLGGDGAIAVLVEQGEGLLELCDLLFSKLLARHGGYVIMQQTLMNGRCQEEDGGGG